MEHGPLHKRWSLRDFGSLQFLWDALSGEYIKVYGPGAVRDDGPWSLDVSSGRAELVRFAGGGEDVLRLDPEELASVKVRPSEGGKLMVVDECQFGRQSLPLRDWLDSSRRKAESKALVLPVQGYSEFECVCSWEAVPHLCGDKPVCIWMDFKWLLTFVFGKKAVRFTWRYAANLSAHLQKLGLDESHIEESGRSQASKRRRTAEGASPNDTWKNSDWRVSMLGALLFLENAAFSKTWAKCALGRTDSAKRAEALLGALLQWPRHGETGVAFTFPKTECQLLLNGMVIDHECLVESEEHLGNDKGILKIGSLVDEENSHLFDLLKERRQKLRNRSRLSASNIDKLESCLVELSEAFADLCETTRASPEWFHKDVLDLAVLTTPKGRCRDIPSSYKASVVGAVRDSGGLAGRTVSGLVKGMSRAASKHVTARRKLGRTNGSFARMVAKQAVRAAKSQSEHAHPEAVNLEGRVKPWERLGYFLTGQRLAAKQHRVSLTMDATDISYKKTLNATMCLPALDLAMWLPPMDLGGPEGRGLAFHVASLTDLAGTSGLLGSLRSTCSSYPFGLRFVGPLAPCGALAPCLPHTESKIELALSTVQPT